MTMRIYANILAVIGIILFSIGMGCIDTILGFISGGVLCMAACFMLRAEEDFK